MSAIHPDLAVSAERDAHQIRTFCEMLYRLQVVGLTEDNSYYFAISQTELAEALGFTTVHINRLLRDLRDKELATFRGKRVKIHDLKGLEELADFDPGYLYLQPRSQ